nr:hypothetical protein [Micromonospora sp. DSM 115978]
MKIQDPAPRQDPVAGDTADWYAAGWERLGRKAYAEAARCFREYLSRAQVAAGAAGRADLRRRAEVHGAAAVALLAVNPPAGPVPGASGQVRRVEARIAAVTDHLLAARSTVLGQVLAAIVREDYYRATGVEPPIALAAIADRADFARLTRDDLALLLQHLAPTGGQPWALLRHRARQLDVPVRGFRPPTARRQPTAASHPPVSHPPVNQPPVNQPPVNQPAVSQPAASQPPAHRPRASYPLPDPHGARWSGDSDTARILLASGFGLLVLAVVTFAVVGDPALASCLAVLSFGAGCGLLASGLRAGRRRPRRRR